MAYCQKCGKEVNDEAVVCIHCGCPINSTKIISQNSNGLKTTAKIFMIISTIIFAIWLIPLCWCIPMIVNLSDSIRTNKPLSIEFKICTLLFVNVVAGILLLCDKD